MSRAQELMQLLISSGALRTADARLKIATSVLKDQTIAELQALARENISSEWKRDAYVKAISYDENRNRVELDSSSVANAIEEGRPRRDMRTYNWNWKPGKNARYVDIRMDKSMSAVQSFSESHGTGDHPGGGSLMGYLRSLRPAMSVRTPDGNIQTSAIGGGVASRVAAGTVRRINEQLHVSDPFSRGVMLASAYSMRRAGAVNIEYSGMRIWRRMSEMKGRGETWMAPEWPAAKLFDKLKLSVGMQEALQEFSEARKQIILDAFREVLGGY
jgi:hypothetical protein